jgi:lysophospholipase L1-like esterase
MRGAAAVVALLVAGCAVSSGPVPSASPAATATATAGTASAATSDGDTGPRLRYVSLGDSYTIGTSVEARERFPDQLVAALGPEAPTLRLVANLGVNGYTSADLIRDELPALDDLQPEFVTVLIGVNDVVQGVSIEAYEANVVTILDSLLSRLAADRIVSIAIPDYTVTPAGADYDDPDRQHDGIVASNAVMERFAGERGMAYVDIFDLSLRAAADRSLVAPDGLHPSGAQYRLWVERILPVVERLIAP